MRQAPAVIKGKPHGFYIAPPPKPDEWMRKIAGSEIFRQQAERFSVSDIRPLLERLGWTG
jgi:hypothetical protein